MITTPDHHHDDDEATTITYINEATIMNDNETTTITNDNTWDELQLYCIYKFFIALRVHHD